MKFLIFLKSSLLISFLLNCFVSYGQENSVDFLSGIDFTNAIITITSDGDEVVQGINAKRASVQNRLATQRLNFRMGFNLNLPVNDKREYKIGIRYSESSYHTGLENLETDDLIFEAVKPDGTINAIQISYSQGGRFNQIPKYRTYRLLEIPFSVKFYLNKKRLSSFYELGISSMFNLSTKIVETNSETSVVSTENNRFQAVLFLSYGINYQLSDQLGIFIQPIARLQINKNEVSYFEERFYSFGLEMGIKKYLN